MDTLQLTIPARDKTLAVRIRPREVREWLDNLPYLDPERATRLASHQLRVMNRQALAAGARLEILGDFLAAYQRLTESLPASAGAADTTRQLLKRLCQDIGFGYKIVVHELANARSRLLDGRNLSISLVGAMHTLGMQLMHYYSAYQRAPRALWSECLAIYRYARRRGRHSCSTKLPGVGELRLDIAFHLIALLRHANPYGRPPGMAAALQRYLGMHAHLGALRSDAAALAAPACVPLTATPQGAGTASQAVLALDVTDLLTQLAADIAGLKRYQQARAIGMPPEVPATDLLRTLEQLLKDLESPPSRGKEREATHTAIELVVGLDAAYCVFNNGRHFDPGLFLTSGHEERTDLSCPPAPESLSRETQPTVIPCLTINRSGGGVALSHRNQTRDGPRVGQLVAVRRAASAPSGAWVLAACRWLVEADGGAGFDIGLQYLARDVRPVVIRPGTGLAAYGDCQPALTIQQKSGGQPMRTLIAPTGAALPGTSVTVHDQGRRYRLRCVELLESGTGFQRLVCLPLD
jgi:hypothetical protein